MGVDFNPYDLPSGANYFGPLDPSDGIEMPIGVKDMMTKNLSLEQQQARNIPISELGTTVVESDPRTGAGILQNIEANIRKGASTMQLVWTTPGGQQGNPIGGRPKAYGKDVRNAIKEMLIANDINLSGSEMPTSSHTNMSGFDMQRNTISEEKRLKDLQEVKDAIDFQVDVAGGGGIDIWSQEFVRDITDAKWNKRENNSRFFDYSKAELKYKDQIQDYLAGEKIFDENGKQIDKPAYDEKIETMKLLFDERTGRAVQDIKKSTLIQRPKYMNAQRIDEEYNTGEEGYVGRYSEDKAKAFGYSKDDPKARITPDDFVDLKGRWLSNKEQDLIDRVPEWNKKEKRFESETLNWADVELETKKFNDRHNEDEHLSPQEMAFRLQMENQILQSRGSSLFYTQQYNQQRDNIMELQRNKEEFMNRVEEIKQNFSNEEDQKFAIEKEAEKYARDLADPSESPSQYKRVLSKMSSNPEQFFNAQLDSAQHSMKHIHEASGSADARADEMLETRKHVKTPDDIALANSKKSYAELGAYAMRKAADKNADPNKPVYVGPELGWPQAYGGHPEEFIELITESRKQMAKNLTDKNHNDYKPGMSDKEARELANKHIRGNFDTSHLAMWYNHFEAKPGEAEEKRLERFNQWYIEEVDKMAKADVIGAIQVVDAITGQHSHLPAGQGIFPVVESVKRLKEKGWKGHIVSEGHEEEKFGDGRILTETWKAFGANVSSGYFGSGPSMGAQSWRGVQSSYFGATQPPTYIVGAYTPSNEWSLWSEVPFE